MALTSISGITSYAIQDLFLGDLDKDLIGIEKNGFEQIQSLVFSNDKLKNIVYKIINNPHAKDYDIHISSASPQNIEQKTKAILKSEPTYLKDFRDCQGKRSEAEITVIVLQENQNVGIFSSNILSDENTANLTQSLERVNAFLTTGLFQPIHVEFPQKPRVGHEKLRKIEQLTSKQIEKAIKSGLMQNIFKDGLKSFHKPINKDNKDEAHAIAGNIATVDSAKGDTIMFQYLAEQRIEKSDIVFFNDNTNNHNNERFARNGGLLLQIARKHGAAAVITQGDIRDTEEYAELNDLRVWAKEKTPNGPSKTNSGYIYAPLNWANKYTVNTNDVCLISADDKRYIIPQENIDKILAGDFSGNTNRKYDEIDDKLTDNYILNKANEDRENKYKAYQQSIINRISKTNNTKKIPIITHQTLSQELLEKLYSSPTAEVADALSTQENYICGMTAEHQHMQKLSGISVILVTDNKKDVIEKINKLKSKDVLVFINPNQKLKVDEDIIKAAHKKKIAGIISNTQIDTSEIQTEIPIFTIKPNHLTHIDEKTGNIKVQNIPINTGYIISGDSNGIVCIPPQFLHIAIIGIDKIRLKEDKTTRDIQNGTAKNKELPRGITKLNGHPLGYQFALYQTASEIESTQSRGSSNLVITTPSMVKVINAARFKPLTHQQISDQAKPISNKKKIQGIPTKLILPNGQNSAAFELKTKNGEVYVTDLSGLQFNELALAQENKNTVTIDSK